MEHPFVNSAAGNFAPLLGTAAVDTGAGVYIEPGSPGLVDSCVIRNCDCGTNWDSFRGGLAITLDGGEARNCLIVENSSATAFGS